MNHSIGKQLNLIGYCFAVLITCAPIAVSAAPTIEAAHIAGPHLLQQGALIEIKGSGFGEKAVAAPVLYDHVSHAYEYGVLKDNYASWADMQLVPTAEEDESAVWATRKSKIFFAKDKSKRHEHSKASYFIQGPNAWIGRPVAYGGPGGWDTPTDNPQLYLSWWYKNKYHSTRYWRFSPQDQTGDFIPGETVTTSSGGRGQYVGIDKDGLLNAVLYVEKRYLKNTTIKGDWSGAKTVFPDHFRAGSGTGYETPGSKLARIWDDPSGHGSHGLRSSVALHDFYVGVPDGYEKAKIYDSLKLPSNEWVHLEYELDTDRGIIRMWEDGRFRGEDNFDPDATYRGKYSPTVALIGHNAHQLMLQEAEISEIYMDSTLQRVVVGDASNYRDVTHRELQLPVSWSDDTVKIRLNLGGLDPASGLYLYVFDKDGKVNAEGVPLCDGRACKAPPQQITLGVE